MKVILNTTGTFSNTYNIYKLARGVFNYQDHEGIDIDYEHKLDESSSVTITFVEFSWRETTKLDELTALIRLLLPEAGEKL
jgi:hypothetical protein